MTAWLTKKKIPIGQKATSAVYLDNNMHMMPKTNPKIVVVTIRDVLAIFNLLFFAMIRNPFLSQSQWIINTKTREIQHYFFPQIGLQRGGEVSRFGRINFAGFQERS
jgi:hypothetical protein